MLKFIFKIGLLICFVLTFSTAWAEEEHWTGLNGPYWAAGIDVAYGKGGENQDWHRYLIASDGDVQKLFYWGEINPKWSEWAPLATANKLISYKMEEDNGQKAFCIGYADMVWMTEDGGVQWDGVPGSDALPNKQFAALEIDEGQPGAKCFVGSLHMADEASVYQGELSGSQWDWSPIGQSGLGGYDIYDLEYPYSGNGYLVAGTDDGIWRINLEDDPDWTQVEGLEGIEISVMEALDYHNAMWAATGVVEGYRRLYFSSSLVSAPWDSYMEIEPGGVPFDKIVNDISAIYVTDEIEEYQSIYIATEEGLYLLDIVNADQNTEIRDYIDFQEDNEYFQNSPFKIDSRITSIDYFQENNSSLDRYVLVGTTHNIYLITEIRGENEREIESITIEEIVDGTFPMNVASLAFPRYDLIGVSTVIVGSPEGLIKRGDLNSWKLTGLANLEHADYQGTDLVAEGTGNALASAADVHNENGQIIYSSDYGVTWVPGAPSPRQRGGIAVKTIYQNL